MNEMMQASSSVRNNLPIRRQQFISDNNAGMCPAALDAVIEANAGAHAMGYGNDEWTAQAVEKLQVLFETNVAVHFVFSGTAANALALAQLTQSYNAVIAHAFSHIEMDEAGAPGFFSGGAKILTAATKDAKLTVQAVEKLTAEFSGSVHHVKASALSLSQSTEFGTVYTVDEIAALCKAAHDNGLKVHMDGARFANAVASTDAAPADLSWRAGVDILCFGGVKNGLGAGECVLIFDPALNREFEWRVKQAGQLNSKMRLVSAGWVGLLDNDVWLKNAQHANAMARLLASKILAVPGIHIMYPVQANVVFAQLSEPVQTALRGRGWKFYTFLPPDGCRLMCAWDTLPETIEAFIKDLTDLA